jgi:hypothetical protein
MVLAEAASVIGMIKNASDFIRSFKGTESTKELMAGFVDLSKQLVEIREKVSEIDAERDVLRGRIKTLEAKIAKKNEFNKKAKDYVCTETAGHAFVYVKKGAGDATAQPPYFCPHCFGNEKFTMLQPKHPYYKFCPECGTEYLFTKLAGGGVFEC